MASTDQLLELVAVAAHRMRSAVDLGASSGSPGPALESALGDVASELVRSGVADWCLVDLASEGARDLRLVAVAHARPAEVERARAARTRLGPLPVRTSEPALVATGSPLAAELGWSSAIAAPIESRGRRLGILTFAVSGDRVLGAPELALARSLVGLLAGGIDTAWLVAERDELLSVVSHDLRNPLGVILLVIDLLRTVELPNEIGSQMGRLERASQAMSGIITDVVDIGRLGTASVPLDLASLSAAGALESALSGSAAAAAAKGVTFDRSIDPTLQVLADRNRLGRALDLLVAGAVQRTPPHRSVAVSVQRQGDLVVWSVADGAPPLPPDPSSSAPVAIRRRAGAFTWMVVRGVLRAHGGSVWVDESADRVTLRLSLPVAAASSSGAV